MGTLTYIGLGIIILLVMFTFSDVELQDKIINKSGPLKSLFEKLKEFSQYFDGDNVIKIKDIEYEKLGMIKVKEEVEVEVGCETDDNCDDYYGDDCINFGNCECVSGICYRNLV